MPNHNDWRFLGPLRRPGKWLCIAGSENKRAYRVCSVALQVARRNTFGPGSRRRAQRRHSSIMFSRMRSLTTPLFVLLIATIGGAQPEDVLLTATHGKLNDTVRQALA